MKRIRGEVIIDEDFCQGCQYCIVACKKGCLQMSKDKITSRGFLIPSFVKPEECSACGICALMCPALAIEVYRLELKVSEV